LKYFLGISFKIISDLLIGVGCAGWLPVEDTSLLFRSLIIYESILFYLTNIR